MSKAIVIKELTRHKFKPGEEIPLVEFMYKPTDQDDINHFQGEYNVGAKFPEPDKDEAVIFVPEGRAYFIFMYELEENDTSGWCIHYHKDNVPVALHNTGYLV